MAGVNKGKPYFTKKGTKIKKSISEEWWNLCCVKILSKSNKIAAC